MNLAFRERDLSRIVFLRPRCHRFVASKIKNRRVWEKGNFSSKKKKKKENWREWENSLRAAFESNFSSSVKQRMHYGDYRSGVYCYFHFQHSSEPRQKYYLITKGVSPFESKSDFYVFSESNSGFLFFKKSIPIIKSRWKQVLTAIGFVSKANSS